MTRNFHRGPDGSRPVHGLDKYYQNGLAQRDPVLFYEYFHNSGGFLAAPAAKATGVVWRPTCNSKGGKNDESAL
ncbi:MAG TPA: hypothetical protein VFQ91_20380 [Bryobacteraceae bacterium]|nr:hypothetical protein [Bryobacteraceae bacterium]